LIIRNERNTRTSTLPLDYELILKLILILCHGLGFSSKPGSSIATTLSYSTRIYGVNTPILNTT
jgi:hypothetical protein